MKSEVIHFKGSLFVSSVTFFKYKLNENKINNHVLQLRYYFKIV